VHVRVQLTPYTPLPAAAAAVAAAAAAAAVAEAGEAEMPAEMDNIHGKHAWKRVLEAPEIRLRAEDNTR